VDSQPTSILLLACIAGCISFAHGALAGTSTLNNDEIESFLEAVITADVAMALDDLVRDSAFAEQDLNEISAIKTAASAAYNAYGPPIAYEQICVIEHSASLASRIYLMKTAQRPTAWTFVYYRGTNEWTLSKLSFADSLPDFSNCAAPDNQLAQEPANNGWLWQPVNKRKPGPKRYGR
jgi:hypothetical protein